MAEAPVPDRPNFTATRPDGLRSLVYADVLMRALRKFRILSWNPPGGLII
jgi:hypothetical protein